jgi:bifunctional DNA-binding transcriptional regulator/antitoxin component of YhaV-PrlF toxin-antitoxin module
MTTTISMSTKRQVVLPKSFCDRKKIKPGTSLRVTEIGEGLYVTPVPEPTEGDLKKVIVNAGSLLRRQTSKEEAEVQAAIDKYRAQKARHRR